MTEADLNVQILNLDAVIAGYSAKLIALAADPKPSYSLDGETFDREKWRDHLLIGIRTAVETQQALIAAFNAQHPWALSTRQVVR
jgi:hypothetical protein